MFVRESLLLTVSDLYLNLVDNTIGTSILSNVAYWLQNFWCNCIYSTQIKFVATRLQGDWSLGHNHGLVHIDDVEVAGIGTCDLLPPDAIPPTTTPQPTSPPPTGTLLFLCL